jgi:hypothetical protein
MPWQHEMFGIVKNIFLLLRIADRIVSVFGGALRSQGSIIWGPFFWPPGPRECWVYKLKLFWR